MKRFSLTCVALLGVYLIYGNTPCRGDGAPANQIARAVLDLQATDATIRTNASRALILLGDTCVPDLRTALQDGRLRDGLAFAEALQVLKYIDTEAAARVLVEVVDRNMTGVPNVLMKSEDRVRAAYPAYAALTDMGHPPTTVVRDAIHDSSGVKKDLLMRALHLFESR